MPSLGCLDILIGDAHLLLVERRTFMLVWKHDSSLHMVLTLIILDSSCWGGNAIVGVVVRLGPVVAWLLNRGSSVMCTRLTLGDVDVSFGIVIGFNVGLVANQILKNVLKIVYRAYWVMSSLIVWFDCESQIRVSIGFSFFLGDDHLLSGHIALNSGGNHQSIS